MTYARIFGIKQKKLVSTSLVLVALFLCVLANPSKTAFALSGGDFKTGNIISDSIFFNKDAMSSSDIQRFLDAKVPVCDTSGSRIYSGSQTRAQYGASRGYPAPYVCLKGYSQTTPSVAAESGLCGDYNGGDKSSARIIYDVAQSCGINPQVLLVLLQKEQSLVTDDWPWSNQYRSATGYACPDTAPCDSQYYGFFNQVYNAARIYKKYARDASLYNYRANRVNSILYNPNHACGRSDVFIQNQATAGLYVYTPYQPNAAALNNLYGTGDGCSAYGNRNFWRLFNDWFGTTVGVQDLVTDGQGIYYVSDGYRYYIPSMEDYYNYGYRDSDIAQITRVSTATLNNTPAKNGFSRPSVVIASHEQGIYLVSDGYRHYIPAMNILYEYGFSDSDIMLISESSMSRFKVTSKPLGHFISDASGFAYKVEDGKRRGIFQPWVLSQYPEASATSWLSWATINKIQIGVPLTKGKLGLTSGSQVFVAVNDRWFTVKDREVATCVGVEGVVTMHSNQTKPGDAISTINSCFVINENNDRYLMDGSLKYEIQENNNIQYSSISNTYGIDSMATKSYSSHKNILATKDGIYQLSNGSVRHIMSMSYVEAIKGTSQVDQLRTDSLRHLSKAGNIYPTGALIAGQQRGINVVANDRILYIGSMAQFNNYGFNLNSVSVVGDAEINKQTMGGNLPNAKVTCAGKYHVVSSGTRYVVPSGFVDNFGGANSFENIDCGLSSRLQEKNMTRFVTSPNNSSIYYIDNGVRRHILSWQTFLSLGGGNAGNVVTLSDHAFNSFPKGANL